MGAQVPRYLGTIRQPPASFRLHALASSSPRLEPALLSPETPFRVTRHTLLPLARHMPIHESPGCQDRPPITKCVIVIASEIRRQHLDNLRLSVSCPAGAKRSGDPPASQHCPPVCHSVLQACRPVRLSSQPAAVETCSPRAKRTRSPSLNNKWRQNARAGFARAWLQCVCKATALRGSPYGVARAATLRAGQR